MNPTLCKVGDTKKQRRQLFQVALEHRIDHTFPVKYILRTKRAAKKSNFIQLFVN